MTAPHRVLYLSFGTPELYRMIRDAARPGFELLTLDAENEAERLDKLARSDAVIVANTRFTAERIQAARQLKFVHHQGVGYQDTIDCAALAETGLPLAITPGGTSVGVAEHTVLLILAVLKRLPFADAELRQGRFHINALRHVSYELAGKTVGLIGLGRIGRAVAARLKPFGVRLTYHDMDAAPAEVEADLGITRLPFPELLAGADIVSIHTPLTAETRGLIDAAALARMKPGAFIVNTARGGIIDEGALIEALREGRLAGAGLDVFETEPMPATHPLYALPNVVLTPHISAGTRDAFTTKMRFIFENLEAFFAGRPVQNLITHAGMAAGSPRP